MDFVAQLHKEHSRANTDLIANSIGNNAQLFKKIIDIIYNEEAPLPQRASWLLPVVNNKYPELLVPYISKFSKTVVNFTVDGIKRNMLSVLEKHIIPKNEQGKLVNVCFDYLLSPDETVAVKVYAMQIIANICVEHPELKNELKVVINDQLLKNTAAFYSRANKILKTL
ncbi:MAG: hypothetical protein WBM13_06400 [Bacteroidia bacterium]